MRSPALWIVLGVILLAAGLLLEGWRQHRRLKARGERPGSGARMLGAGALELQKIMQPDRKVEIVQQQALNREVLLPGQAQQEGNGDGTGTPQGGDGVR